MLPTCLFPGASEAGLAGVFAAARALTPAVLFIDEVDAIASARRGSSGYRSGVGTAGRQRQAHRHDGARGLVLLAGGWSVERRVGRCMHRCLVEHLGANVHVIADLNMLTLNPPSCAAQQTRELGCWLRC
jgi:SpoVK/Ycf46/Vps4 family AAA+-type ATPase